MFTKTSDRDFENAVVVIRADVSSPVIEGVTTNFDADSSVVPVTEIFFTYQVTETKTVKKALDKRIDGTI